MDRKLPDWLKESREAEKLIAWLKSPDCEVKEFSGQMQDMETVSFSLNV